MNKIKNIGKIIYWLILIALFLVAGLTAISALNFPGNYKMMVVLSGSMEPTIKTGSIVVVKPESIYKEGDVITFKDPNKPKYSITHRIAEIKGDKFITKGDANKAADNDNIGKNQVLGKLLLAVPFVGYPVNFAKTQNGLIILIIIPAVIIIYSELLNIKNETKRLIEARKKRKLTTEEKIKEKIGEEMIKAEKEIKKVINY